MEFHNSTPPPGIGDGLRLNEIRLKVKDSQIEFVDPRMGYGVLSIMVVERIKLAREDILEKFNIWGPQV